MTADALVESTARALVADVDVGRLDPIGVELVGGGASSGALVGAIRDRRALGRGSGR